MPRSRGYLLVEALVALALLAAMATLTLHAIVRGAETARSAAFQARASVAADELASRLRLLDRAGRGEAATSGWVSGACQAEHAAGAAAGVVARRQWLAEVACALPAAALRIRPRSAGGVWVELRWEDPAAEPRAQFVRRAVP